MPNLCKITVIGHLGRDAEVKTVGQGQVVEFTIAYSHRAKDQETTTWFRCTFWGERAVKVAQYLTKGKAVCVTGGLSEREYDAKDGTKKRSLEVRVDDLALLGGKDDAGHAAPVAPERPAAQPPVSRTAPSSAAYDNEPPF